MSIKRKVKLKNMGVEEDVMYGDVYTGADATLAMSEEAGVMGMKIDPMRSAAQQQQEVDIKQAKRKATVKRKPKSKKKKKSRKGKVSYKR